MTVLLRKPAHRTGRWRTGSGQVRSVGMGSIVRSNVSIGVTCASDNSRGLAADTRKCEREPKLPFAR